MSRQTERRKAQLANKRSEVQAEEPFHPDYRVCFTHMVEDTPDGPKISAVPVWTQILQNSGKTIYTHLSPDNSISLGGVSPQNPLPADDAQVPSGATHAAIRNVVYFSPPVSPGEMNGRMSYTLHYGFDPDHEDHKMVIKGRLYVNIWPDGRNRAAGFTPDPDSVGGFIDSDCQIIKRPNNVNGN